MHCWDKISDNGNLQIQGSILAYSSSVWSIIAEKSRQRELKGPGNIACIQSRSRKRKASCLTLFLFFSVPQTQAYRIVLSIFRVVLPPINLIQKFLPRQAQSFVSMVILKSVRLIININHHSSTAVQISIEQCLGNLLLG